MERCVLRVTDIEEYVVLTALTVGIRTKRVIIQNVATVWFWLLESVAELVFASADVGNVCSCKTFNHIDNRYRMCVGKRFRNAAELFTFVDHIQLINEMGLKYK